MAESHPLTQADLNRYEAHLRANGLGDSFIRPLIAQQRRAMELLERLANNQKWRAAVERKIKGKRIFCWSRYFEEEFDAAQAYNFVAEEVFGEYAVLNTVGAAG